ncbi:MAG: acetylornithine aminotransferase [Bacteroidetes bacterium GWF2_42_66]|nr:MAG: acetylornithine aminotransferase [Bacteroidetes bacterium GWA2_42_15]OFX99391.1 MAG: acetylornithine aminotransferase [Bacteroidetes bacterium GWE2_42_39]OFY40443.1 MAG: acetylornithine aminotransferase [Bacteroidetes bacterium GWF2_42_66]HBL76936.1 aspartate aminotransferase family protein [Prolixibacteraceae bacterium]HCR90828.1 aspartate aminotransferase family protein [Prolixibacteraceae bacterium]
MELFDVYPLFNITPVKAEGCYVWDDKGNKYLDLYGGHAVISVGHSHPHYIEKIEQQLESIGFYSNSVIIPQQKELAEKLGKMSGYDDYQLFLCNSGAEANENAIKLASFVTGRKKIVSFKNCFHGRTSAAVAVTDNPKIVAPVNQTENAVILPYENLDELQKALSTKEIAAVIIEGIQGIGGIHVPSSIFLNQVAALCKTHGTLLILDEIQSGYGRSGKFFAHQYSGITPDVITTAKGMGNGFPVGGVMIAPSIKPWYGMLGTTFGGNYLACAASIAVLDIMKNENLVENAAKVGQFLISRLNENEQIKEVRGKGLMIGIEFDFPIKEIRQQLLFEHKIFTGVSGTNIIRLLPSLTLSMEQAVYFMEKFEQVLSSNLVQTN